jgi:hypothetical protein
MQAACLKVETVETPACSLLSLEASKMCSDTGNRTPSCRDRSESVTESSGVPSHRLTVRGGNVSRYTISEYSFFVLGTYSTVL